MKHIFIIGFITLLMVALVTGSVAGTGAVENKENINKSDYGHLPLYFIPNKGQVDERAAFYAKTAGYTLWLTQKGLLFDGNSSKGNSNLEFVGSLSNVNISGAIPGNHVVNYIRGNNPANWQLGLKTSKAVLYTQLYKNIDLKVYGIEKQIEYDWIVKPGAQTDAIRFKHSGAKKTHIDASGNLMVETENGHFSHQKPYSYQIINGQKEEIQAEFKKINDDTYGFEVGEYNKSLPLIIDPVVVVYATFLGGTGDEHAVCLAVDGTGSSYIAGDTDSTDFPVKGEYETNSSGGTTDAFISKLTPSGKGLLFSTYLGGSGADEAEGIGVDSSGQVYITGFTSSSDLPVLGSLQAANGGGKDAFVTILSSITGTMEYSTYLGGSGDDRGFALALDSSNNIYVTGDTSSTDFPGKNNFQAAHGGGTFDAFVTKINITGGTLAFSTYLGGSGSETGYGIAVNGGNVYVTGQTASTDFPKLNAYQSAHAGGTYDVFVTQFSPTGKSLIYSSFLGGTGNDSGYGITIDGTGNAFVAGSTGSSDFPTQSAYQSTYGGGDWDAFLTAFAPGGTTVNFSTYLGGKEADGAAHVALSSAGRPYIAGYTESSDFPAVRASQASYNGGLDAFASGFSTTGNNLVFSTFIGGSSMESARGIVVDASDNIYVAGFTESSDFPGVNEYQDALKGTVDAFIIKYSNPNNATLCDALDSCHLTWTTGGAADWFVEYGSDNVDGDSARSGNIGNSVSTWIETTVTGPGTLTFKWKASSSYSDYLRFYIGGSVQSSISGNTGWLEKTFNISEGSHTLRWSYEKNAYSSYRSDAGWVDSVRFVPESQLKVNRNQLTFGVIQGGTVIDQFFTVSNTVSDDFNWTTICDQTWLSCSPGLGNSLQKLRVAVDASGLSAGTYTANITVTCAEAGNSPLTVPVTLNVYGANGSSAPFGLYATPTDNATIMSSVPFTGWVLDDIGVESVKLYRRENGGLIFIGDAIMVEGSRPDVELAYPDYPQNNKAGWGYMMLTNMLPDGGNSTYTIVAIATDVEGHTTTLGSRTLTIDNANAVKPFGAIDTPVQGGVASGNTYINWGWVLTPMPNQIATDGSTINVWVDGVNLGNPLYNIYRADIATLFPGYANSGGAIGYFALDTTAYADGIHTIQWTAKDNAGNSDGIGSRYFMIDNSAQPSQRNGIRTNYTIPPIGDTKLNEIPVNIHTPAKFSRGYKDAREGRDMEQVYPDEQGVINVEIKELDRFQLRLNRAKVSGFMKVGTLLKPLPAGSHLDRDNGRFSWGTGIAFTGKYHLVFIGEDQFGNKTLTHVNVHIRPRY